MSEIYNSDLEVQIQDGDLSLIRIYVDEAIRDHLHNHVELQRRKKLIGKTCMGDADGVFCYAMLCALTQDKDGWSAAEEYFGETIDPSMGFHAFRFLKAQTQDAGVLSDWEFLVEASARRGHIQARNYLFDRKTAHLGVLKWPLVILQRIWTGLVFLTLYARNSDDPRLPLVVERRSI